MGEKRGEIGGFPMTILGIDFGRKNLGIALASGPLAEPLTVLPNSPKGLDHLRRICEEEEVEKIVVGISEGQMARETQLFAQNVRQMLNRPVQLHDETLSTHEAIERLIASRAKQKKRRDLDAFAATIILQDYLDHGKLE